MDTTLLSLEVRKMLMEDGIKMNKKQSKKNKSPIPSGIKAKPFRWEDSYYIEAIYTIKEPEHFPLRRVKRAALFLELD